MFLNIPHRLGRILRPRPGCAARHKVLIVMPVHSPKSEWIVYDVLGGHWLPVLNILSVIAAHSVLDHRNNRTGLGGCGGRLFAIYHSSLLSLNRSEGRERRVLCVSRVLRSSGRGLTDPDVVTADRYPMAGLLLLLPVVLGFSQAGALERAAVSRIDIKAAVNKGHGCSPQGC